MEQTTSELADALREAEVDAALQQRILDYLGEADLVKFARFHPALDAARRAPDAGLALLRAIEKAVATRAAETHAEHPGLKTPSGCCYSCCCPFCSTAMCART